MEKSRFAGVDRASEEHAVCVLDAEGGIVESRRYRHDERGIRALCARLIALAVELVAIERPDRLPIERLLDQGLSVIAIHPSQVATMQPRFTVAGGKSDSFDAFVLAALARTDSHRFRELVPDRDQTKAPRAFSRAAEDLVDQRIALANEPRVQPESFRPGAAHGFAELDSPIALALLERYPSPADTRALGEQRMARFLARQHDCARRNARKPLGRPHAGACGRAGTLETEARRQTVLTLIAAPEPIVTRIGELTSEIRAALGDQARVAIQPGTSKRAHFRYARDHRPRAAICTLADTSHHHNACAADIDNRARARGCTHRHAIRILAPACCGVIWRPWQDRDVYHPARHTARQRLTTTTARHPPRSPLPDVTAAQRLGVSCVSSSATTGHEIPSIDLPPVLMKRARRRMLAPSSSLVHSSTQVCRGSPATRHGGWPDAESSDGNERSRGIGQVGP